MHHLNIEVGAGYPKPNSLTQKVSDNFGLKRLVEIEMCVSFADFSILSKLPIILSEICGDSTNVSDDIT